MPPAKRPSRRKTAKRTPRKPPSARAALQKANRRTLDMAEAIYNGCSTAEFAATFRVRKRQAQLIIRGDRCPEVAEAVEALVSDFRRTQGHRIRTLQAAAMDALQDHIKNAQLGVVVAEGSKLETMPHYSVRQQATSAALSLAGVMPQSGSSTGSTAPGDPNDPSTGMTPGQVLHVLTALKPDGKPPGGET